MRTAADADADGDGQIDYQEFVSLMNKRKRVLSIASKVSFATGGAVSKRAVDYADGSRRPRGPCERSPCTSWGLCLSPLDASSRLSRRTKPRFIPWHRSSIRPSQARP